MKTTYYKASNLEIIHLKDRPMVYKEHNHVSNYTLGIVLDGEVWLQREDLEFFPAFSFFVVPPFQMHALLLDSDYEMISISIHKSFLAEKYPQQLYTLLAEKLLGLFPKLDMRKLQEAINVLYICEPAQPDNKSVLLSVETLWNNPESNNDLQSLAEQAHVSKSYFISIFRQSVGMTPHKFKLQNRVRRAQRLIENGEELTQLAVNLGFYDQSHFIKCFKSIVGLTPSEYRQAVQRLP